MQQHQLTIVIGPVSTVCFDLISARLVLPVFTIDRKPSGARTPTGCGHLVVLEGPQWLENSDQIVCHVVARHCPLTPNGARRVTLGVPGQTPDQPHSLRKACQA